MVFDKLRDIVRSVSLERKYKRIIRERREQLPVLQEIDRLRSSERYKDPKSLIPFGHKAFSQSDEDGIIREIFNRIGTTNKLFVEFGIGSGLENNSLALLFDGWQGLWIDASARSVRAVRKHFAPVIEAGQLAIAESFITKSNIDRLIAAHIHAEEIDLLSVDIDGNDYHVLAAISCVSPRAIVVEYNAKFPPPLLFCMDYDETHRWEKDDCFGASLKFLEVRLSERGYRLVGCNISGVNAFFVRDDLAGDRFLTPYTAEQHYEPARYYLSGYFAGHPTSYRTLAKSLAMRPPASN